ncbi:hypothetical protein [Reichenbachiella ulvae]|uniref:N-acetyltransferase domain-containing protein n=1 Tax=Reichenbachiella ulvae TaxID=2980104 RepID=A0ABT3CVJ2_9BACT|nr:hypothetical protein [Reichenbachiella ulvae]MCV9387711.1 hypothetical protein [Reichenbachiella ulvae]
MLTIKKVSNKSDLKRFIDFPHDLYANDDNYVPELFLAQKDMMDKKKYPFFNHSEADFFIALKGEEVVGRIAAIKNNNYIEYTGENSGSFGFFDVIEDYEVAKALLDKAAEWVASKGVEQFTGPYNYSTNETCGVLVDGYDHPPTVMMTYNKPYYSEFLEKYGFEKDMDILSYKIMTADLPDKLVRMSDLLKSRLETKGVTIRKARMNDFNGEIDRVFKIYNKAWEKNWGFVPMLEEEFKHTAKDLKMILDPDFLLIAEANGEPIGFSLSLPDFNMVLKRLKRGRLLPFGIFKLLYYKRKINRVRVITLGIVEEYRKLGIDAYFYYKSFEESQRKNHEYGEASWVLESNEMMNNALKKINGKVYKRHRLFKKAI